MFRSRRNKKKIDEEFALDIINQGFDESEEIEKELEHDEREEESEYETEDLFCRMFHA